ncbi:hypothetical protein [Nocardioides sp. HB32]
MFLGMCLIIVALVGWSIAATMTKPASQAARQRDLDRRFRQVYRHPERVTFLDVENLMLSESLPETTVIRVLDRATAHRIGARTMWRWAGVHGTSRLVMVIDAGVAEDSLLDHLDAGTAPDWAALTVFATLANDRLPNGIPVEELIDLDVVPDHGDLTFLEDLADWSTVTADPLELRQFDNLPPIAGPGLAPFRPIAAWDDDHGDPGSPGGPSGPGPAPAGPDWPAVA